jgi:hypothetical protein
MSRKSDITAFGLDYGEAYIHHDATGCMCCVCACALSSEASKQAKAKIEGLPIVQEQFKFIDAASFTYELRRGFEGNAASFKVEFSAKGKYALKGNGR